MLIQPPSCQGQSLRSGKSSLLSCSRLASLTFPPSAFVPCSLKGPWLPWPSSRRVLSTSLSQHSPIISSESGMLGVYVNPHLLRPRQGEKAAGMLIETGPTTHFCMRGGHDLSLDEKKTHRSACCADAEPVPLTTVQITENVWWVTYACSLAEITLCIRTSWTRWFK